MVEVLRNEGGLFSDYYFAELLRTEHRGQLGETTRGTAWKRLSRQWAKASRALGSATLAGRTRQLWLYPLFEEMGYTLVECPDIHDDAGLRLSSSHAYGPSDKGPALVYVDLPAYGQDPDAPLPSQSKRNTPHRRMERLLDAGEARWGIVCNGRVARLLHREQLTTGLRYFEVDLETMFDENREKDFEIFWALFRADAFVPDSEGNCLIDRIRAGCSRYAVRVSDELRESIRIALENFVKGLLSDAGNTEHLRDATPQKLFKEGLVFLYRLLFILYAESRALLPIGNKTYRESYSMESLRDLVDETENLLPGEYRIWKSLRALFMMIRDGIDAGDLLLYPYNGGLFSKKETPLLDHCLVPDNCLGIVLQTLSLTAPQRKIGRERISYRDLGVEELGAIYEGLLQYEPKIASEEMAFARLDVKRKKEEKIVPLSQVRKEQIIEQIPKATFYLATWGGSRKQSGTYNTPKPITEWLVKRALEPLARGKSADEILSLRVLDPAMGSGAFLVAACNFLGDAYAAALVAEQKEVAERIDDEARADYRRLVAERCIYGVDLNPMAVELAKVSLWLTTVAEGKPLTFLDHHLRCGDSLVGGRLQDLGQYPIESVSQRKQSQVGMQPLAQTTMLHFVEPGISALTHTITMLIQQRGDTLEIVKQKASAFEHDHREGSFYQRMKLAADLSCALWFWPDDTPMPNEDIYRQLVDQILHENSCLHERDAQKYIQTAQIVASQYGFLHWEIEFPEVFFDSMGKSLGNPGFDAVIGNPPWEIVEPNSKEFFSAFDPRFRDLGKQEALKRIAELCREPDIASLWKKYKDTIRQKRLFFARSVAYSKCGSDVNSYKLFLAKFFQLARNSGKIAIIVPSGLSTDEGAQQLREMLFEKSNITDWYTFENKRRIFPIHRSFKFIMFSAGKGGRTEVLPCAFYLHDLKVLEYLAVVRLRVPMEKIRKFSPKTMSIMEFRNQEDLDITTKLYDNHPLLGDIVAGRWNVRFVQGDFNRTAHSKLFNRKGIGWPLWEGKMLHQFQDNFAPAKYWIEEKTGLQELSKRYSGGSAPSVDLSGRTVKLPPTQYRLAFRDVARSTDKRTMIAAILPPGRFLSNKAPYVADNQLGNKGAVPVMPSSMDLSYLCGLLNSHVVDFVVREKVSATLNFFYLEQLPIPRVERSHPFFKEIASRVARVTCTTSEYDTFARECGLECSSLSYEKRLEIIAEIDALVAHLYGLEENEFRHVLSTFPIVPEEVKKMTLKKFTELSYMRPIAPMWS
jgi:hypothetical protein